ncbi:unnamed protein product [Mytilus edulis]|uniref:RNase H type-1 domain-containing protein n=1 Tax=Mytilus edulis TaxID=6550 RepID=A0A8S3QNK2_MYTED|nr:unnamed protein product [Mytilus edulis]
MERIITTRVECYVESENILDIEQEGFRHFRSTTNALLNLTQSILDGFNLDNFTLAVLIDFEKAYDSVWREGLLVKLHQYGIKGKIWKWIQAFLNERYSRCIVNKHEGQWCRTETGLPQGNKKHPGTVHLVLGNQPIKYNPNPKLLGVTLDEKLTFSEHINIIEKKAGKSLGILREIKGIGNIKTKFLIQVYNSIIGSIFLYASCIWQTGKEEHLKKLNAIQRKGLSICLGVSATASLEVLQVMAGVLPLDLRREEMAIRDIARLNSYSTKIPIRNKIDEWKNKETVDKFISPLGLMLQQAKNMKEETDISVDDIEPEYQFQALQASKSPPEYWLSPSTVVAFTDGSCQSNPGPCGAGAIVIFNNKEIELKQPVSKRGSILLAELVAIKLVLDYVSRIENKTLIEEVKIFSDSQTAIGILTLNWKIENNRSTSHEIISLIKCIQKHHGIRINFDWTPGHADVRGNEIADKLAKEAAKEANQIQKEAHITVTKQDIKTAARILVNKKWQHRWDNSDTGRFYYNFHQTVSNKSTFDYPDHKTAKIIRNLRSGYYLKNYQNKINQNIDPKCECGQLETVEHYLLFCENYEEARQKLIHEIYFNTGSLHIDLELLLSIEKNDNVSVSNETLMRLLDWFTDFKYISPPVEAAVGVSNDDTVTENTPDNNTCMVDISAIVQEQVQLQIQNLFKKKLIDINANVLDVQPPGKPSSVTLQNQRPHFDKFKSYDDQMSLMTNVDQDQVSYLDPEEKIDGSASPRSSQMYTCTPVEVPQGAPGASDPIEWISFINKMATVLNIEPEASETHQERPSFVSARLKPDKNDKKSAIKLPLEGTIIDMVKSVEKEVISGHLKTELFVAGMIRLSWLRKM